MLLIMEAPRFLLKYFQLFGTMKGSGRCPKGSGKVVFALHTKDL